jgi:hypothetical protein
MHIIHCTYNNFWGILKHFFGEFLEGDFPYGKFLTPPHPPPQWYPLCCFALVARKILLSMSISVADEKHKRKRHWQNSSFVHLNWISLKKTFPTQYPLGRLKEFLRNTHLDIRKNEATILASVDSPHSTVLLPSHQQEIRNY